MIKGLKKFELVVLIEKNESQNVRRVIQTLEKSLTSSSANLRDVKLVSLKEKR